MMVYWLKEDIVLRGPSATADTLDVYFPVQGAWRPYTYRRRDLEFVTRLTPEEARRELVRAGVSPADAKRAIP
jgi:hypothetical protein